MNTKLIFERIETSKLLEIKREIEQVIDVRQETSLTLIEELDISARCINCLKAADIKYLEELTNFKELELLKFSHFGKKSLTEIREQLKLKGLSWKK